jgi:hypothetical protein
MQRGHQHGSALEDWFDAEDEIINQTRPLQQARRRFVGYGREQDVEKVRQHVLAISPNSRITFLGTAKVFNGLLDNEA